MSGHPEAEASTWQHTTHKGQNSMPSAGLEFAIPACEQPHTHALDRPCGQWDRHPDLELLEEICYFNVVDFRNWQEDTEVLGGRPLVCQVQNPGIRPED